MIDVLVVDDDFRVAEINAKYVRRVPGFRVTACAHDSYTALRRTVDRVGGSGIAGQEQVDRIFGALRTTPAPPSPGLPSGHSEPTTDLICRVLHRADHPLSAHEVAAETGLSRSTA